MVSELDLDKNIEASGSYRGERQKALILKQLYNMNEQLSDEMKHYESLYQANKLYRIAKR